MKLGDVELIPGGTTAPRRIAGIIWGPAGVGKTSFAVTAPGKKLLINIDPDGHHSVSYRDDVIIADLAGRSSDDVCRILCNTDPLYVGKFLDSPEGQAVETVILDSTTTLVERCLEVAVKEGWGRSQKFTPSLEAPGMTGYRARNKKFMQVITGLLRQTSRRNKHMIMLGHEADPKIDERTSEIIHISMMLGGQLVTSTALQLSEIWYMGTRGNKRMLTVRPYLKRQPMKSRMFAQNSDAEFDLHYDQTKPDDNPGQHTIAGWYKSWVEAGGQKLPIPGTAKPQLTKVRKHG